jgi:hypothetical protein
MIGRHDRSCRLICCRRAGREAASSDSPVAACYPGGGPRSAGVAAGGGDSGKRLGTQKAWTPKRIGVEASVARCLRTRPAELNPLGLQTWSFKPLTRPEQPEHSCRLQLLHSPITAEQYREKTRPLRPRRSCFAPAEAREPSAAWWASVEAPGAAPGSEWFIATALYFHSRQASPLNIGGKSLEKQGRTGRCSGGKQGWNWPDWLVPAVRPILIR